MHEIKLNLDELVQLPTKLDLYKNNNVYLFTPTSCKPNYLKLLLPTHQHGYKKVA
jgi:hypothetical protein